MTQAGRHTWRRIALGIGLAVLLVPSAPRAGDDYVRQIDEWHAGRIARLRKPTGWMTLVGLYKIPPGASRFGSAADNDLVFPDFAPAQAGVLHNEDGQVTLEPVEGVAIHHDETVVEGSLLLRPDTAEDTTVLTMDRLQFYVIERAGKPLLRVRDLEHPALKTFEGIDRYPVSEQWRKVARFEPFDPPKELHIPDVLGNVLTTTCPGALVFEHEGKTVRLLPTQEGDELFIVFGDSTNGDETYGGGRYIYADMPAEGSDEVIVDFNKAYNPPCVFTPYATCTLPTPENTFDFPVRAGEKVYHGYEH